MTCPPEPDPVPMRVSTALASAAGPAPAIEIKPSGLSLDQPPLAAIKRSFVVHAGTAEPLVVAAFPRSHKRGLLKRCQPPRKTVTHGSHSLHENRLSTPKNALGDLQTAVAIMFRFLGRKGCEFDSHLAQSHRLDTWSTR